MSLLIDNMRAVRRVCILLDWDYIMLLDGMERIGKTTLLLLMMLATDKKLNRLVLCADYAPVLARCAWTWEQCKEIMATLKGGDAYAYNESLMLGRRAMSKVNVDMVSTLTTMGNRNLIGLWSTPRKSKLDPYLRMERIKIWGHVYTIHGTRGYVEFKARDPSIDHASMLDDSSMWIGLFHYGFPDIRTLGPTYSELWSQYVDLETKVKDTYLRTMGTDGLNTQ